MSEGNRGVTLADVGADGRSPFSRPARRAKMSYSSLEEAFPEVNPRHRPFGSMVLVQIKTPAKKTEGGIVLVKSDTDTERDNTQVAKVLMLGPVAYRNRDTLEEWPEKAWVHPGMYVRVPKYGGDRWEIPVDESDSEYCALFAMFNDLDMKGEVLDPLGIVAYL